MGSIGPRWDTRESKPNFDALTIGVSLDSNCLNHRPKTLESCLLAYYTTTSPINIPYAVLRARTHINPGLHAITCKIRSIPLVKLLPHLLSCAIAIYPNQSCMLLSLNLVHMHRTDALSPSLPYTDIRRCASIDTVESHKSIGDHA